MQPITWRNQSNRLLIGTQKIVSIPDVFIFPILVWRKLHSNVRLSLIQTKSGSALTFMLKKNWCKCVSHKTLSLSNIFTTSLFRYSAYVQLQKHYVGLSYVSSLLVISFAYCALRIYKPRNFNFDCSRSY